MALTHSQSQTPALQRGLARGLALIAVVFGAALVVAGCKPNVGDTCEKGKAACIDGKSMLSCQEGKFISVPCKGAKGCGVEGDSVKCDVSGNAAGDLCSKDDEGTGACSADGKAQVVCKGGKFASTPCRGPKGCKDATCDNSLSHLGDPCDMTGLLCTDDGKAAARCKDGKWVKEQDCANPCKVEGETIVCDAPAKAAP